MRETLLPRAESFLEFLDMTSVSFEPQSDLMRRPAMEGIHTDPQPDLMCSLTKNSMKFRRLCLHAFSGVIRSSGLNFQ